jgi:hypothetical protein
MRLIMIWVGPYAPGILRFQVSFPVNYPESPPVIAFTSDIFHPLVTPLTTYTHSAGALSSDTVSASDEGRLPPGGFNLKYGFPTWFGLARHEGTTTASSRDVGVLCEGEDYQHQSSSEALSSTRSVPGDPLQAPSSLIWTNPRKNGIAEVLAYVKKAFDDERTLDNLPFESAGNPGAWKAWHAHRPNTVEHSTQTEGTRQSDEWNWDGVWQERVRKGIEASISGPVLYGSSASANDDPVGFETFYVTI